MNHTSSLIILMFHRVFDESQGFDEEAFEQYLKYLISHFHITMPGEPLKKNKINICLTFDDAYCDFYFHVYPLLKKYNIKAVLGVTTDYIVDSTTHTQNVRLSVPYPQGMENEVWLKQVPFCTWDELKQMHDSGYVSMASHSASHPHLTDPDCDLAREIIDSKNLLSEKLNANINSFIYPFGDFNKKVHRMVREHYDWDLRIGSALNKTWQTKGPLYRVDAEKYWPSNIPFSDKLLRKMNFKYWVNQLRGK